MPVCKKHGYFDAWVISCPECAEEENENHSQKG